MAIDPISLALGFLGGGGSTSQNSTLTGTNTLQSTITPNTVISIGGSVASDPAAPYFGGSSASGQGAIATPENPNPLGGFGMPFGTIPQTYADPVVSSYGGNVISDNLPLLLIGGAAIFFLMRT